ncbi:MAG TPA: hypothetical protein DCF68_09155 [Cyanothece sp. UBA12306]|nr:hypothetical protein [Cyanothece sp. UBA12306]
MPNKYSLGFISNSRSDGEMRVPIWWEHLTENKLNHPLIKEYIFEENFGASAFGGAADEFLISEGYRVVDRLSLLRLSDIVISLKPQDEWNYMKPGSTLIGWFNHLESFPPPSSAIRFLDLEAIKILAQGRSQKLLYRNAFVAGECGVVQTLEILSQIAPFSPAILGKNRLAVVLGYGNLGQGAVTELIRQNFENIVVFTQRQAATIENKFPEVDYRQMEYDLETVYACDSKGVKRSLITDILPDADIIVNGTLPSSSQPDWTFVPDNQFSQLKQNMAYLDPVHKVGHGASFAQITPLREPIKPIHRLNHCIWYNGCNAMPAYRPTYASIIISQHIITYLDYLLKAVENATEVLL